MKGGFCGRVYMGEFHMDVNFIAPKEIPLEVFHLRPEVAPTPKSIKHTARHMYIHFLSDSSSDECSPQHVHRV